ncbi:MAG: hypothetical protein ACYCYO_00935 [Bacilli bacterium]
MKQPPTIPYPLIRTNQWFIIISVALAWTTGAYAWLLPPLMAGLCGLLFGVNPVMRLAWGQYRYKRTQRSREV